jgi:hypothetical protein
LAADAPWYETALSVRERALILVIAEYHGIDPDVAFDKLKEKFLEISGQTI